MTVFDVLSFNKELIRRLDLLGLKLGDYKYINLYSEYEDMYKAGRKNDLYSIFFIGEIWYKRT